MVTLKAVSLVNIFCLLSVFVDQGNVAWSSQIPPNLCGDLCGERVHQQAVKDRKAIAQFMPVMPAPIIDRNFISILIEKSRYRLTVYYGNRPLKSYPIVLGGEPVGDKLRQGDRRTPEGTFRILTGFPHPQWSRFLWLDYPTGSSWSKYVQAMRAGTIRRSDDIGGEIGIHGVPWGMDYWIDYRHNWTFGCIALKNRDIEEIYQLVQSGTLVKIVP